MDGVKVCHFANLMYVYALGCVVCTVYTVLSFLCDVQIPAASTVHAHRLCYFFITVFSAEHIVINTHTCIQASKPVLSSVAVYVHHILIVALYNQSQTKGVLSQVALRQ